MSKNLGILGSGTLQCGVAWKCQPHTGGRWVHTNVIVHISDLHLQFMVGGFFIKIKDFIQCNVGDCGGNVLEKQQQKQQENEGKSLIN